MSFDDWILALHLLSAFAYVAAIVLFWVVVVAVRRAGAPEARIRMEPVVNVGNGAVAVGAGGTLVFGLWLAFSVGGYDIWDPWIIAALVLWAVSGEIGRRTGDEYNAGLNRAKELQASGQSGPNPELLAMNRTHRGVLLLVAASAVLLLLLVDMIWKPGA